MYVDTQGVSRRPKKPRYEPAPRPEPDVAAIHSKRLYGDKPENIIFAVDVLSVIVEQLVAAYVTEGHSMASAVVHSAQDLANMAQGSKALHTTVVMALWHHLSRIAEESKHGLSRYYTPLPRVDNLNWVGAPARLHRPLFSCAVCS